MSAAWGRGGRGGGWVDMGLYVPFLCANPWRGSTFSGLDRIGMYVPFYVKRRAFDGGGLIKRCQGYCCRGRICRRSAEAGREIHILRVYTCARVVPKVLQGNHAQSGAIVRTFSGGEGRRAVWRVVSEDERWAFCVLQVAFFAWAGKAEMCCVRESISAAWTQ